MLLSPVTILYVSSLLCWQVVVTKFWGCSLANTGRNPRIKLFRYCILHWILALAMPLQERSWVVWCLKFSKHRFGYMKIKNLRKKQSLNLDREMLQTLCSSIFMIHYIQTSIWGLPHLNGPASRSGICQRFLNWDHTIALHVHHMCPAHVIKMPRGKS